MIVTDLEYSLEKKLIDKLDILITRCEIKQPKRDALLIIEGGEGEGKTNTSCAISYYIKYKTGRSIRMFFNLEKLIEFAQSTKNQIIIWDEPALDSLSIDHFKNINKDLIRLLMMVRKNRHFFIFNFTKFYKFSEYIVVDRALGLINMYSRDGIHAGRFSYIRKKYLEALYTAYRTSKKRLYFKLRSFGGNIPEVMNKHFNKMQIQVEDKPNATLDDYELEKDKAIMSIGNKKQEVNEIHKLKYAYATCKKEWTKRQRAEYVGIDERTLRLWAELNKKDRREAIRMDFEAEIGANNSTFGKKDNDSPIDILDNNNESISETLD